MIRKVTVTYEVPDDLFKVLEKKAAAEGRRLEDVIAEHVARYQPSRHSMSSEEALQRTAAFERHLGALHSGDEDSSDNERIEADLARYYAGEEGQE